MNRLAKESSPYLRQHSTNPVDWYPWGNEAIQRAQRENRPVFLSIGYSACHWCHVMEQESFEDGATAEILNRYFVNIKVDREERPDLDHIYMSAVQLLSQHGGWPMSVFLTPHLKPFYGGTYFPPEDRGGSPGFKRVLLGIHSAWENRRNEIIQSAESLTQALVELGSPKETTRDEISPTVIQKALGQIRGRFDREFGGFGEAPKFFHTLDLRLCLREAIRNSDESLLKVVTQTLDPLLRGGIYDQLGGGFHRYSTDARWLVPHFEKMLYDNALLPVVFLETYQATGRSEFCHIARETLNYVLREMRDSKGGFYSAQDADTDGEEGAYYTWTYAEIVSLLGKEEGELFCNTYGVTPSGNWEHGKSILHLPAPLQNSSTEDEKWREESLARSRRKLVAKRQEREIPFRDEKILVSMNGLMIGAFAFGSRVLLDSRYHAAASNAATFIWQEMYSKQGLSHVYKDGVSRGPAFLDDYSHFIYGLLELYQADGNPEWFKKSLELADEMVARFWSEKEGLFYYTCDPQNLIIRPRDIQDGATPSANSMAVTVLQRCSRISERSSYSSIVKTALQKEKAGLEKYPLVFSQLLLACDDFLISDSLIFFVPGNSPEAADTVRTEMGRTYLPNALCFTGSAFPGKPARDGQPTLYICKGYTCQEPIVGTEACIKALAELKKQK